MGKLYWPDIKTCEGIVITSIGYWHMGRSIVKWKLEIFQKCHYKSGAKDENIWLSEWKKIVFISCYTETIISRWIKHPNVKSRTLKSVIILYQIETGKNCLNKSQTAQTSKTENFDYIKLNISVAQKTPLLRQNISHILGQDIYNPLN